MHQCDINNIGVVVTNSQTQVKECVILYIILTYIYIYMDGFWLAMGCHWGRVVYCGICRSDVPTVYWFIDQMCPLFIGLLIRCVHYLLVYQSVMSTVYCFIVRLCPLFIHLLISCVYCLLIGCAHSLFVC